MEKAVQRTSSQKLGFNLWAFIFSSWFFLYIGKFGWFVLFNALPVFLMLVFMRWTDPVTAFLIGVMIVHTIAAFVAPPIYQKYKEKNAQEKAQKKVTEMLEAIKEPLVEYYAVSVLRLVVSLLLTDGLYAVYWGFKNWNRYQKTTHSDINPYVNAWFFNLTAAGLFSKMNRTLKTAKNLSLYGWGCLVIFILQIIITSNMFQGNFATEIFNWAIAGLLITCALYMLCFIPVQTAVNKHHTEVLKKDLDKKFYPWEIFFLVIGILLNVNMWFSISMSKRNTFTESEVTNAIISVSHIYEHTEIYPEICAREGYALQNYPLEFKSFYSEDINELETKLAEKGTSIAFILKEVHKRQHNKFLKKTYQEFNRLKIKLTVHFKELGNQIFIKEVHRNDNMLTLADVCQFLDENADFLIEDSLGKDLLKKNTR